MANSKANSKRRPASGQAARPAAARSARTVGAVSATPTSSKATRPAPRAAATEPAADVPVQQPPRPSEQPLWLQVASLVLAVVGLAISAYETYAHFNGNHLAGCPTGTGTFNCAAV